MANVTSLQPGEQEDELLSSFSPPPSLHLQANALPPPLSEMTSTSRCVAQGGGEP